METFGGLILLLLGQLWNPHHEPNTQGWGKALEDKLPPTEGAASFIRGHGSPHPPPQVVIHPGVFPGERQQGSDESSSGISEPRSAGHMAYSSSRLMGTEILLGPPDRGWYGCWKSTSSQLWSILTTKVLKLEWMGTPKIRFGEGRLPIAKAFPRHT